MTWIGVIDKVLDTFFFENKTISNKNEKLLNKYIAELYELGYKVDPLTLEIS